MIVEVEVVQGNVCSDTTFPARLHLATICSVFSGWTRVKTLTVDAQAVTKLGRDLDDRGVVRYAHVEYSTLPIGGGKVGR